MAVSHTCSECLPRNLEFLVAETYKWFSHSSSRQLAYQQLIQTINVGKVPLKILNNCATRWLSIERAVDRIQKQWLELETHFKIMSTSEKCYTAQILYEMYNDNKNMVYLLFLHPILVQVQEVNKIFESNTADKTKLFEDLLIKSIAHMLVLPTSRMDPLVSNIEEFLDPRPNLGYRFKKKIAEMRIEKKITQDDENNLRSRSPHFLLCLFKQLKQRLPDNLNVLKNISLFSVENILKHVKEPIIPILELMCMREEDISAAEYQYNTIHLHQWTNKKNTEQFWVEVNDYKDASGQKPFKDCNKITNLTKF